MTLTGFMGGGLHGNGQESLVVTLKVALQKRDKMACGCHRRFRRCPPRPPLMLSRKLAFTAPSQNDRF